MAEIKSCLSIVNNKNTWLRKMCTHASQRGCGKQIQPSTPRPMPKALLGAQSSLLGKSPRRGRVGLSGKGGCAGGKEHFFGQ